VMYAWRAGSDPRGLIVKRIMQMLRNIRWVMIAALTLAPVVAYGESLQNITVSSGGTKIATASSGSETGGQVTLSSVTYAADFTQYLRYLQKQVTLTATGATTKANFKQDFKVESISAGAMKLSGSALVPPRPSTPAPAQKPKQ
jgi:D-arabinose 1-dehydrogenase-like Zn-dependent alcohol dehydrogenase